MGNSQPRRLADEVAAKILEDKAKAEEADRKMRDKAPAMARESFVWLRKYMLDYPKLTTYRILVQTRRFVDVTYPNRVRDYNLEYKCVNDALYELMYLNGYNLTYKNIPDGVKLTISRRVSAYDAKRSHRVRPLNNSISFAGVPPGS